MRILIVGAGAIGGYYGSRFLQAGADVTFLVRPGRRARLDADGLSVRSDLGDFDGPVNSISSDELKTPFDVIVLSCKAYDLDAAIQDIRPAVGPDSVILPFLNGLGVYDRLDAEFGRDRVLGGVAYIAVTLGSDGVNRHAGTNDVVVVGARSAAGEPQAAALHALFARSAGLRSHASDIVHALWNKWVMLASGAMMNCLMRGTVADILASRDGERLMRQAMSECRNVAQAEGIALSTADVEKLEARLLDRGSGWAASMMRDIAQGAHRIEADAIVGDMLDRAERHGLDVPLLRTAFCHLQVYEKQNRRKTE
ncbi:2-dehydropantoate 2-reductase [Ancylobacter sp. 3268]|uniref:ketopantoate reductase family protein n=1 Tax=Ancylobacter sp. 3268 TaxID=2817752 RepID=UPI002859C6F9|nr:ketopantoate reductase family protein [Ancylobacter sp. 3268]MDR6955935.1 2-dehydropantoate 2-reductase [Ancylobacter sp. 3268]